MARYLLALFIWLAVCALGVGVAHGQTTTAPEPLPSITSCTPVGFQYDYLTLGRHIVVLCAKPLGTGVYAHGFSCLHASCSPSTLGMASMAVMTAKDSRAELQAQWDKHIKWACHAPPDAAAVTLCNERSTWIGANFANWTKDFRPAVWRVKANGTYTSRPAQFLTNGVLSDTKQRAPVNALCDVSKPTAPATNGDVRAEFGTAGVVAICTRTQ